MSETNPTRRQFIVCSGCTFAAMACAQPVQPKDGFQDGDSGNQAQYPTFDPCAAIADPSWQTIDYESLTNLHTVGGSTIVTVAGRSILIAHVEDGCFIGVDSACTHEGETLNYQTIGNRITCPRHAATFGLDGRVIAGPTPVPLQSYPIALEDDLLYIQVAG